MHFCRPGTRKSWPSRDRDPDREQAKSLPRLPSRALSLGAAICFSSCLAGFGDEAKPIEADLGMTPVFELRNAYDTARETRSELGVMSASRLELAVSFDSSANDSNTTNGPPSALPSPR